MTKFFYDYLINFSIKAIGFVIFAITIAISTEVYYVPEYTIKICPFAIITLFFLIKLEENRKYNDFLEQKDGCWAEGATYMHAHAEKKIRFSSVSKGTQIDEDHIKYDVEIGFKNSPGSELSGEMVLRRHGGEIGVSEFSTGNLTVFFRKGFHTIKISDVQISGKEKTAKHFYFEN